MLQAVKPWLPFFGSKIDAKQGKDGAQDTKTATAAQQALEEIKKDSQVEGKKGLCEKITSIGAGIVAIPVTIWQIFSDKILSKKEKAPSQPKPRTATPTSPLATLGHEAFACSVSKTAAEGSIMDRLLKYFDPNAQKVSFEDAYQKAFDAYTATLDDKDKPVVGDQQSFETFLAKARQDAANGVQLAIDLLKTFGEEVAPKPAQTAAASSLALEDGDLPEAAEKITTFKDQMQAFFARKDMSEEVDGSFAAFIVAVGKKLDELAEKVEGQTWLASLNAKEENKTSFEKIVESYFTKTVNITRGSDPDYKANLFNQNLPGHVQRVTKQLLKNLKSFTAA